MKYVFYEDMSFFRHNLLKEHANSYYHQPPRPTPFNVFLPFQTPARTRNLITLIQNNKLNYIYK